RNYVLPGRIVQYLGPGDAVGGNCLSKPVPLFFACSKFFAYANNLKTFVFVFCVQFLQVRMTFAAPAAPASPEIDQKNLSFKAADIEYAPVRHYAGKRNQLHFACPVE